MRDAVPFDGVDYGLRSHIRKMHEHAGEKREPNIYGDKPENMIKRKERKLLQRAVIMLFHPFAAFNDVVAADNKASKLFRRIRADLNAFGRHNEYLASEA